MERTTWRWYRTWLEWETKRWTTPDHYEYLLARIAQRVQQGNAKHPSQVNVKDQFIPWVIKNQTTNSETKKEAVENSKAIWTGMIEASGGLKVIRKTKPRT